MGRAHAREKTYREEKDDNGREGRDHTHSTEMDSCRHQSETVTHASLRRTNTLGVTPRETHHCGRETHMRERHTHVTSITPTTVTGNGEGPRDYNGASIKLPILPAITVLTVIRKIFSIPQFLRTYPAHVCVDKYTCECQGSRTRDTC